MITFSDCMTLLLCFFVLLLTFSSFEDARRTQIKGAIKQPTEKNWSSIWSNLSLSRDSTVEHPSSVTDWTDDGAEKPDAVSDEAIENPKTHEAIINDDAFSDRKVFYIPQGQVFLGHGRIFTRRGREILKQIGSFMEMVPCMMVASQVNPTGSDPDTMQQGLDRSWAIVDHLIGARGLPSARFSVSMSAGRPPSRYYDKRVIKITLIPEDVTK